MSDAVRVLIVDDEEPIRRLLGNVLRKQGFEVLLAENGMEGIVLAVAQGPKLILMDLDMPRMSGSEAIVQLKTIPSTQAIPILVLTGKSTKENIERAQEAGADGILVKSQFKLNPFLAKVFEVLHEGQTPNSDRKQEPKKAPRREKRSVATAPRKVDRPVDRIMKREEVEKRIKGVLEMKALPFVAQELVKLTSSSQSDARELARTIERDQGLTAQILKLANSAFFAQSGRVQSLHAAVTNIGYNSVRQLALAVSLVEEYKGDSGALSRLEFWKHSLATAILCKDIAAALEWDGDRTDNAFLAGLLHDMGQAILDENFQEEYAQILKLARKRSLPLHEIEERALEIDHTEIPSSLIGKWKLPDSLLGPVRWHHTSWLEVLGKKDIDHALVALVQLGDAVVGAMGIGSDENDVLGTIPTELFRHLDIERETMMSVLGGLPDKVSELTQILLIHDISAARSMTDARPFGRSLRLIIVDPRDPVADPLQIFLERHGFSVERKDTLPDAFLQSTPPIIVIHAESMGWLDEAIVQLDDVKMQGRRPQFLIVTEGAVPKGLRGRWAERGASFIREPVSMGALARVLSKMAEA